MGGLSSFVGNLTGGLIGTSDAERAVGGLQAVSETAKKESLEELGLAWEDIQSYLQPYLEVGSTALQDYKDAIGIAPDAPVFEGMDFSLDSIKQNPVYDFAKEYMQAGSQALQEYKTGLGEAPKAPTFEEFSFDFSEFKDSEAFNFMKEQAMQAGTRAMAKNKALTSGNRIHAMQQLATNLAGTQYTNEFQRQLQTYEANLGRKLTEFEVQNLLHQQKQAGLADVATRGERAAALGSTEQMNEFQRQLYGHETGEVAKGKTFDARNLLNRQRIGDISGLMTAGANMAGNLSTFRQNLASARTGIIANRAAESTAATLLPIQETQGFVQGLMGMGGMALGGMAAGGTGLFAPSDIRVKENIELVGQLDNGLNVYKFNYIGFDTPIIGVMAQEVEKVHPDAVVEIDGIKHVNYEEAVKPVNYH